MNEIKLTSTYYLPEVISALVQEGYTLEVKRGRNEDEIIIRWALADRKTEPTISKMEQVEDEPTTQTETQNSNLTFKTLEYCDICDHKGCKECISNALDEYCVPSHYHKVEDEPQNCDTCKLKGFEGCEQPCLGCGCCGLYEPKDEPQTDCAWR